MSKTRDHLDALAEREYFALTADGQRRLVEARSLADADSLAKQRYGSRVLGVFTSDAAAKAAWREHRERPKPN